LRTISPLYGYCMTVVLELCSSMMFFPSRIGIVAMWSGGSSLLLYAMVVGGFKIFLANAEEGCTSRSVTLMVYLLWLYWRLEDSVNEDCNTHPSMSTSNMSELKRQRGPPEAGRSYPHPHHQDY